MERLATLTRIFQEVFDDEGIVLTPATGPDQLADWDSVAQVKLVLSVEMEFGIRFTTDEVAGMHSVGDILAGLDRHLGT
jgi:acyl carrier protein